MKEHDNIINLQMKLSEPFTDTKPSKVIEINFIYALNKNNIQTTKKSGKWILFFDDNDSLDLSWEKIKKSTENGDLGVYSKVVTNAPGRPYKNKVICVYTYDYEDKEDIIRVREKLKHLGFKEKISYKKDIDTFKKRYKLRGDKNISLFFC